MGKSYEYSKYTKIYSLTKELEIFIVNNLPEMSKCNDAGYTLKGLWAKIRDE